MSRLTAILLHPLVWLVALFGAWAYHFQSEITPQPRHTAPVGAADDLGMTSSDPSTWSSLLGVSDDGTRVTVGVHHSRGRHDVETSVEVWDVATGRNETPRPWRDPDWRGPLSFAPRSDTGLLPILSRSAGSSFLNDEAAWHAFRERMTAARGDAIDDLRRTLRPVDDDEVSGLFPIGTSFSPSGRLFAYVVRNGRPLYLVSPSLGDGTAVDDLRTGKRVAMLPGVTDGVAIAPDDRTAVSRTVPADREGERPRLVLWDLAASTRRAELLLPDGGRPYPEYSPDGRYVFADCSPWPSSVRSLRWWDAATGQSVGQVDNVADLAIVAGGRVLVTKPRPPRRTGLSESYAMLFWDVASGAQVGRWDLAAPSDGSGLIGGLTGSADGRHLAGVFDPDYGRGPGLGRRVADRLARASDGHRPDGKRVVVWDVEDRREVASLPGRSAAFSADGRWLAAMDSRGVARVWEVPPTRPWASILGSAGLAALGSVAALALACRLLARRGPGWARRVGRGVRWLRASRRRRLGTAAVAGGMAASVVAMAAYSMAAARARAELLAVYEEVNATPGLTEADVTALAGRPPAAGPVAEIAGRKKGGGRTDGPATLRKWTRYGTELDVFFGADGTIRLVYVSNPLDWGEQIAVWLGL